LHELTQNYEALSDCIFRLPEFQLTSIALFHAFTIGWLSSEFVNLAAELQRDLSTLKCAVPRRVSLNPFSGASLQALSHRPIDLRPTAVNVSDFVDSFELVGELQAIARFVRGDKTTPNLALFNLVRDEHARASPRDGGPLFVPGAARGLRNALDMAVNTLTVPHVLK
jgi:hypothetical protein